MEGFIAIALVVLLVPYFIPTVVAISRDHPSKGGIIVVNVLLGWTILGWIVSLAWSLSGRQE